MDSFVTVYIGFGSNLGDSEAVCRQAVQELDSAEQLTVDAVSSLYRTQPIGFTRQDWFLNGVVEARTRMPPRSLLRFLLAVEHRFGRERTVRWGPRTLDLDILFYGTRVLDEPGLTIPHPRAHERRFVLEPMAEIAPGFVHPTLGLSVSELLSDPEVRKQAVERWKPL